jgi:chromosomal replication initiation ATPase DnaA
MTNKPTYDLKALRQTYSYRKEEIDIVMEEVCKYYRLTPDKLTGKSRERDIVLPRMVAMYISREEQLGTLKAIGRHFGGRDHSTVVHAKTTVETFLKSDSEFKTLVEEIGRMCKYKILKFENVSFEFQNPKEVNKNLEVYNELRNDL